MIAVGITWQDNFTPQLRQLSDGKLKNAIRRAVDKSARDARRLSIPIIASDIGVPPGAIRAATPLVRASTQYSLAASWTISKLRIGIRNVQGATISKPGGLRARTHRMTGGGSSSLVVPRAFEVKKGAGRFVAYRVGKARLPVRAIHAEHPGTAMGQSGSAPQKFWTAQAEVGLQTLLPQEIAKATGGGR